MVAFLVSVVVFVGVFFLVLRIGKPGGLNGGRILGRGLVLSASSFARGERTVGAQRFELRDMVLDIELPGQTPYEVAVTPLIPRICEGRPGAALDVAVNPRRPNDIVILGPAGSAAWLNALPSTMGGAAGAAGCGRYAMAALIAGMTAIFSLAFVSVLTKGEHTSAPPSHATTTPTMSAACRSAARCCKVVGGSCTQFGSMSEAACTRALQTETAAAAKAHKRCP